MWIEGQYITLSSRTSQNRELYSYLQEHLGSCSKSWNRRVSRKTVWWRIVSLNPSNRRGGLYCTDNSFTTSSDLVGKQSVCFKCLYFPESFGQCSKVVLNRRWIKECLEGLGNTEYPQMETSQTRREHRMGIAPRVSFSTAVVNNARWISHKHTKCSSQVCRYYKFCRQGR